MEHPCSPRNSASSPRSLEKQLLLFLFVGDVACVAPSKKPLGGYVIKQGVANPRNSTSSLGSLEKQLSLFLFVDDVACVAPSKKAHRQLRDQPGCCEPKELYEFLGFIRETAVAVSLRRRRSVCRSF